jgi:hypothetical protein
VNATTTVSVLRTGGSSALSVGALTVPGNVYAKTVYARPTAPGENVYGEATVRVVSGSFSGFKVLFQWQRVPSGPTQLAGATFLGAKNRMTFSSPAPADTVTTSLMVLGIAVTGPGDVFAVDSASLMGIPLSLAPSAWMQYTGNNAAFGTTGADAVDQYGDPVDLVTVIASGVPFSILEQSSNEMDPSTGESRVVRYILGRSYPGLDLKRGDRVKDERTGVLYAVDGVTRPQSPVGTPDLRSELRQLGG